MDCTVTEESLSGLDSNWADLHPGLTPLFVSPVWLWTWWQEFSSGNELFLRAVHRGEETIGLAPLRVRDSTAYFIGSSDVCDYQDFMALPGQEAEFFDTLLDYLKSQGIEKLELGAVRNDSLVHTVLAGLCEERGYKVESWQEDVSLEMDLPPTWDEYLMTLSTKQRHEVRRKLRRVTEAAEIDFRFIENNGTLKKSMDVFFELFTSSREDKADFLTEPIETFFRQMADAMAAAGRLRLGALSLDKKSVAMIMCFDYNNCVYLYNSGYDPEYNYLSVGLMSKVLGIKDSIRRGRKKFDFLKGAERYKYHLGGKEVFLYRCNIDMG